MLRISRDLALPLDAVTQAIAILARKGAGKTYTASVLVEEVVRAKVPVVVVDPTGAWWGLRTSVDGERPGLPVVIFGGDHGDVPLDPAAGKVIAEVVVEHPGAYVVDLSAFESKAAEIRFAADFFERLYRAKKRETGPLLLVVDEADVFAPQRPGPDQTRTLGALEAIVRRGRIKGLGDLLISQRAAVLNKNVLTQTEVLVVMQTTGPQDRAAVDAWIEGNGTREERDEVLGSLASLERGEAWVWSPSFLRILQRVRIRPRTTFDSSRTPEAGETTVVPKAFAKVDLEQLGARIAATVEQAKANDPAALRRRIQQLQSENAARLRVLERRPERIERIEVPVLNGQVDQLAAIVGELRTIGEGMVLAGTGLAGVADSITTAIARVATAPQRPSTSAVAPVAPTPSPRPTPAARPAEQQPAATSDGPVSLGKAERSILSALAGYPIGLTREQLAFLADYHPRTSGFTNAIGALRTAGLVTQGYPAELTPAGHQTMGDAGLAPLVGPLVEMWLGRFGKAERGILAHLIQIYPAAAEREALAELLSYHPRSSGFTNALGRLRGLGIVDGFALHADFARLMDR